MLRTFRRVRQLAYLISSDEFRDGEALRAHPRRRYDTAVEIEHARLTAEDGLTDDEHGALEGFFATARPGARVLVVGSGAGREAVALARAGFAVTGIDLSPGMNAAAPAVSGLNFETTSLESFRSAQKYDLVFIATGIVGHIQGSTARTAFYTTARDLLAPGGQIFTLPGIQKLGVDSPYLWASRLLRLRWLLRDVEWEEGDSARAFYGKHNRDFRPVFYHFHPGRGGFVDEVNRAGLEIATEFEDAFVLRRASGSEPS